MVGLVLAHGLAAVPSHCLLGASTRVKSDNDPFVTLALCGDVMTGRGIDQILPQPVDPVLFESHVQDAREYRALAERAHGAISAPVDFDYVWGEALPELWRADVCIVNLETSITRQGGPWPDKGIHYRMHPANVACLTTASIDCCALANNHVLDWGYAGMEETVATLDAAGIAHAGAGQDAEKAAEPAVLDLSDGTGRVFVVSLGLPTSGIFEAWAAARDRPGVNFVAELDPAAAETIAARLQRVARPGDLTVVSIHWGGNWGHTIPADQVAFAHRLVDAGVDVVHGHSSHHAKGIELRGGGVILYGCGDFLNDYEGINGYEEFRDDLAVLYRATFGGEPRSLVTLELVPYQLRRLQLHRASEADVRWLLEVLNRASERFGTEIILQSNLTLRVKTR